jgi:hypothetical protein
MAPAPVSDGSDLRLDPFRLQANVSDTAQLGRNARHAESGITKVSSGQDVDFVERLIVGNEVERLPGRKDHIQALRQLLERHYEFEMVILIVEDIEERVMVCQVENSRRYRSCLADLS